MSKVFFNYGSMNSGKSVNLLKDAFNYIECKKKVVLMKSSIDDRDGNDVIKSRIGISMNAHIFSSKENIYNLFKKIVEEDKDKIYALFIDECQFMTKDQVIQITDICDNLNIPVLCYGLRTDSFGNLFEGSQHLMANADEINEIKGMCRFSDKKATHVLRVDENGKVIKNGKSIFIGGNDNYISCCRKMYKKYYQQGFVDKEFLK